MSPPESFSKGWTLLPRFDVDGEAGHTERSPRGDPLAMPCPVCRKEHGARLVRNLVVSPVTPATQTIGGAPKIDSRYYPPAVPVLSKRSSGPISLSARWSLSVI
ncbi:MAG TPA: hypothetical protein VGX00_00890 [Thermoplasmata archaeon]|nr:hypothetical protein [Thermoplasmata archaeon]